MKIFALQVKIKFCIYFCNKHNKTTTQALAVLQWNRSSFIEGLSYIDSICSVSAKLSLMNHILNHIIN